MRSRLYIVMALGLITLCASAQNTPNTVTRSVPEKHDQSGVAGKEIVTGSATFPVGASIGFHTHAGDEAGYVARASITLKVRSEADHTVNAGETFFNVRGAVHSVVAGTDGATVVSTWIVDKGTPLATAVQ
jgi:quercetin dioxygenase-like cupin family protein